MSKAIRNQLSALTDKNSLLFNKQPWKNKEFYAFWLSQSYYFVRHSTRLLAFASSEARFDQHDIHRRMAQHISEEVSHEKLAEKDLSKLGFNIKNFSELNATKLFYRNQYFGIKQYGSYYLLGYILLLEGIAIQSGKTLLDTITDSHGSETTSFIRLHSEEDVEHLEKAFEQLKNINAADEAIILESLNMSGELYSSIVYGCGVSLEKSSSNKLFSGLEEASKSIDLI